ncbi:SPOSA6832_01333, partial [Sporobolomyces salmonicolor]
MSCLATPLRFLPVLPNELQLAAVLKSGQSFRWHRSSPLTATLPDSAPSSQAIPSPLEAEEWAFPWGDRTVVLRQDELGLHYRSLYPPAPPHSAFLADLAADTTRKLLISYFNLDTPLAPLYQRWGETDPKFAKKVQGPVGERLRGIRVLRQDEWETLVSFICSANNNIARITLMVNRLCAQLGTPLPHPSHFTASCVHHSPSSLTGPSTLPRPPPNDLALYSFPPPSALTAPSTEALLRQLGFGYRANFIPTSALHLVATAAELGITPEEYLRGLRQAEFLKAGKGGIAEAREKLLEFKGVGRKVADCVLLFGLGWSETVPVDTHVFQIAIRDYAFPSSRTASLTPALHDRVAAHLSSRWGAHAGWCQQVLFFADLKPSTTTTATRAPPKTAAIKIEVKEEWVEEDAGERKRKPTFEEEIAALVATPGAKRSRKTVLKTEVEVEVEVEVEPGVVVDGGEEEGKRKAARSPSASTPRKGKRGTAADALLRGMIGSTKTGAEGTGKAKGRAKAVKVEA